MTNENIPHDHTHMVLTDINIPFLRLVRFFIIAGLAAIPAMIAIWLLGMLVMGTAAYLLGFGGEWGMMGHRWD